MATPRKRQPRKSAPSPATRPRPGAPKPAGKIPAGPADSSTRATRILAWLLRKLVQTVGLSGVDRAMGAALGLARGGFVACLLVLLMGFTALPRDAGWQQSRVVPVLLPGALWLRGWLPGWAAARVDFGASTPYSNESGTALALPQPGA